MTDTKTEIAVALNMHATNLRTLSEIDLNTMPPAGRMQLTELLGVLSSAIRSIAEDVDKLEDAG